MAMSKRDRHEWKREYIQRTGDRFYATYHSLPIGTIPPMDSVQNIIVKATQLYWASDHLVLLFRHLTHDEDSKEKAALCALPHVVDDVPFLRELIRPALDYINKNSEDRHRHSIYGHASIQYYMSDVVDLFTDDELTYMHMTIENTITRMAIIKEMVGRGMFTVETFLQAGDIPRIILNDVECVTMMLDAMESDQLYDPRHRMLSQFSSSPEALCMFLDRLDARSPTALGDYLCHDMRRNGAPTIFHEVIMYHLAPGFYDSNIPSLRLLAERVPQQCLSLYIEDNVTLHECLCVMAQRSDIVLSDEMKETINLFAPRLPKSAHA